MEKVTLAGVKKAAQKNLDPKNLKILVVGDSSQLVTYRKEGKDVPLVRDGKQLTLLSSLELILSEEEKGSLVRLDQNGNRLL